MSRSTIYDISNAEQGPIEEVVFSPSKKKSGNGEVRDDSWARDGLLSDNPSFSSIASMEFLGRQLIEINIEKLLSAFPKISRVTLERSASEHLKSLNPGGRIRPLDIVESEKEEEKASDDDGNTETERQRIPIEPGRVLRLPYNSIVYLSSSEGKLTIEKISHPWNILVVMESLLLDEIKDSSISKNAKIAKTAIIEGPCMIEEGAEIDDYAKIKGPCYIGANSKIGTGSLVRQSIVGRGSIIGFNCEVARTFLAGFDTIPHMDAILDTVIGEYTWMGAFVGTTNVMFDGSNVKYKLNGELVDTGLKHFGTIIGHHCNIGAGTIFLPGRYLPPRSFVMPNTLFSSIEKQTPRG